MKIKDVLEYSKTICPGSVNNYPKLRAPIRCIRKECQTALIRGHKMDDQYVPSKFLMPAIKSQPKLRMFLYKNPPQKISTNCNVNGLGRMLYLIKHHPFTYSHGDLLLTQKLLGYVNLRKGSKFLYHTELSFFIPPASKIRIRKGHFCLEGTAEYESRNTPEADKEGTIEVPIQ